MAQWRDIPEFPNYQASDVGIVRSNRKKTDWQQLHQLTVFKYKKVFVYKKNIRKIVFVHRLIMLAFVGHAPPGMVVAHLNNDPSDNRLVNLKYCTQKENISHKIKHGTFRSRLSRKQVVFIRSSSLRCNVLAEKFGITAGYAAHLKRGGSWGHLRCKIVPPRSSLGEGNAFSKLKEKDVRDIRASHEAPKDLAIKYGVHVTTIRHVLWKMNWKHVV